MKQVSFYSIGTTVYFFRGYDFKLVETVVENVKIDVPDVGDPSVTYTVEDNKLPVQLSSDRVYDDREALKNKILEQFKGNNVTEETL